MYHQKHVHFNCLVTVKAYFPTSSGTTNIFFPIVPATIGRLADSGFLKNFLYQGGLRSTVSWVFEDLNFKISDG